MTRSSVFVVASAIAIAICWVRLDVVSMVATLGKSPSESEPHLKSTPIPAAPVEASLPPGVHPASKRTDALGCASLEGKTIRGGIHPTTHEGLSHPTQENNQQRQQPHRLKTGRTMDMAFVPRPRPGQAFAMQKSLAETGVFPVKIPQSHTPHMAHSPAAWVHVPDSLYLTAHQQDEIQAMAEKLLDTIQETDKVAAAPETKIAMRNRATYSSDKEFRRKFGQQAWMEHHIQAHHLELIKSN